MRATSQDELYDALLLWASDRAARRASHPAIDKEQACTCFAARCALFSAFLQQNLILALYAAVEEGDADRTAELLREVPRDLIDSVGPEGDMLLHLACLYGHEPCVRLLLQHNASTAVLDEDNGTVLHDAAATGCVSIQQHG